MVFDVQGCISNMAEGKGFEPLVGCPTTVFKTVAFGRSASPPGQADGTSPGPSPVAVPGA